MSSDSDYVITIIHHDVESKTYVQGFQDRGEYVKEIDYYGVSRNQLKMLKVCKNTQ